MQKPRNRCLRKRDGLQWVDDKDDCPVGRNASGFASHCSSSSLLLGGQQRRLHGCLWHVCLSCGDSSCSSNGCSSSGSLTAALATSAAASLTAEHLRRDRMLQDKRRCRLCSRRRWWRWWPRRLQKRLPWWPGHAHGSVLRRLRQQRRWGRWWHLPVLRPRCRSWDRPDTWRLRCLWRRGPQWRRWRVHPALKALRRQGQHPRRRRWLGRCCRHCSVVPASTIEGGLKHNWHFKGAHCDERPASLVVVL